MSGIVLAGGRSSRFRGDKLATALDGAPLLHHAVTRVAEVADEVVVVLAPEVSEPAMPSGVVVRFVRDAVADEGPLAGALAGLAATEADVSIVVGGDMPSLVVDVLGELVRAVSKAPADAASLQEGDGFRPLPVAVRTRPARSIGFALLADGERSLRAWLRAMRVAVIDESAWTALDPARATLHDVDEPEDLRRRA